MKKLFSLTMLAFLGTGLYAQGEDPVDQIYREYQGDKVSLSLNIGGDILEDFDLDIDTDEMRQVIKGDVEKLRIIQFDDYQPALRSQKDIITKLFKAGYEYVSVENQWEIDEDSQVLIFKKAGRPRSPHLIMMINDRDDREALLLILSGDIIFKTEAL